MTAMTTMTTMTTKNAVISLFPSRPTPPAPSAPHTRRPSRDGAAKALAQPLCETLEPRALCAADTTNPSVTPGFGSQPSLVLVDLSRPVDFSSLAAQLSLAASATGSDRQVLEAAVLAGLQAGKRSLTIGLAQWFAPLAGGIGSGANFGGVVDGSGSVFAIGSGVIISNSLVISADTQRAVNASRQTGAGWVNFAAPSIEFLPVLNAPVATQSRPVVLSAYFSQTWDGDAD